MIFGVLILVVIVGGVGVALMMKSKSAGGSADDGMMSVPPRPAAAEPPAQTLSERLEQHTNVTVVPGASPEVADEEPTVESEPRELTPFEASPDLSVISDDPIDYAPSAPAEPVVEPAAEPAPPAAAEPAPVAPVADEAPEPLVRARVQPAAEPKAAPVVSDAEDDDEAVVARLRVPGQRPVKAVDLSAPPARDEVPAPAADEGPHEAPTLLPSFLEPEPAPEPEPEREPELEPADAGPSASDAVAAAEPEPEPDVVAPDELPEPVAVLEPEPQPEALEPQPEPEPLPEPEPEPVLGAVQDEAPEPVVEPAAEAPAATDPIAVFDVTAETATDQPEAAEEPDVFAALYEAQISGDLNRIDDEPVAAEPVAASVPAEEGDGAIEPEVATGTTPPPVQFVLEPEPEADPVDHILKALVNRAKARQVGIAEVAAELVEQANLEDRDIDEVLADLVERVDEDEEQVNPAARLEELTFFNESVPRRPGQITDYDRLDKAAKKKVIIRVLCLLVAMQEDNRLKPSDPRSEAETRHWPLARAVWPVPIGSTAEADAAADEASGEEADGEKKLPGRRLLRTKR